MIYGIKQQQQLGGFHLKESILRHHEMFFLKVCDILWIDSNIQHTFFNNKNRGQAFFTVIFEYLVINLK